MNPFLKILYSYSIALIFLTFLPFQLRAAPTVSLSLDRDTILVNKIFSLELVVSWEGDADQYLIAPPHITLPEGIEEKGSSFSSTSRGARYLLGYKYALCAQKEGEYVIKPFEIRYWEKGNNKEGKIETGALHFQITSFSIFNLGRYWLVGILTITFLGLFSTLIVLYKKKKRRSDDQESDNTAMREMIVREFDQCNAYKLQGDWKNYIEKVIAIRNKLPTQDENKKVMEYFDTLAERVAYGGLRLTTEDINLIQRQLERAFRSAFPNGKDEDLDGIEFR